MLPSPRRLAAVLLLPSTLAACAPSVHVFPLEEARGAAPSAARADDRPVRLYLDEAPRCPYARVARLTVEPYEEGQALWTEGVAARLRARARALGADAIVGLREITEDQGTRLVHSGQRTRDSTRTVRAETTAVVRARLEYLEGYAVRFTEAGCRE